MRFFLVLTLFLTLTISEAQAPITLRLITHDSFNISEDILTQFQDESGITVEIVRLGDTGTLVNQAILTQNNPLGDVLYGIDNTFLTRGLEADLFLPYESPRLETVDPAFVLDEEWRVTPVNYGDVCLNYDVAYFAEQELDVPESLADLTLPEYRGLLVIPNPVVSSPGLAFLLGTIAVFGEDEYLDYWEDLVANDVLIVNDWTTAYYSEFTVPSESGTRPLVVSYASSPPAEVYFADPMPETAPTGAIVADETCFRQIEFVGILRGTQHETAAQQWIDFMLSLEFQSDLPLQMFVFPVNAEAELPDVFVEHALIPENPLTLPIADIEANRETWLQAWTETVLR
ncbi:MAG: thiamine ABC transporter substrate-binding protein [Anaerolineae bacterium]|jgi:thiamine transport system substrate-binding protein|nr:thiamine ABC transporter substrate-binding protein [Anaerolineae bacterium]